MVDFDYQEARKSATREYRRAIARGESPYPACLDQVIPAQKLTEGQHLGREQIPLALVIGTKNEGRNHAFARNFMPLLDNDSEFAAKWKSLCQSHLEEGIREPVKLYEYRNRFYVEEGNKRVSVLKFFDADSIDATVIRIPAERTGSQVKTEKTGSQVGTEEDGSCAKAGAAAESEDSETRMYEAFLDFYEKSRLRTVEFSHPESFLRLQQLMGKETVWTEDERREFKSMYYYFHREYTRAGGNGGLPWVCDAMLRFIERYGYENVCQMYGGQIRNAVEASAEELGIHRTRKDQTISTLKKLPETTLEEGKRIYAQGSRQVMQGGKQVVRGGRQVVQSSVQSGKQVVRGGRQVVQSSVQSGRQVVQSSVQSGRQVVQSSVQSGKQVVRGGRQVVRSSVQGGKRVMQSGMRGGWNVVQTGRRLARSTKMKEKISALKHAVGAGRNSGGYLPQFEESAAGKPDGSRRRFRILALADDECREYYEDYREGNLDGFDLILACGDLQRVYLEFLTTMAACPVLYVRGNHDDQLLEEEPGGCICIEDRVYCYEGLRIAGLGGSYRYRDGKNMYTEEQMRKRARKLTRQIRRNGGFDILVTHAPARGINDFDSISHRGFETFRLLLERYRPQYFVHGHIHKNYGVRIPQRSVWNGTTVINAYQRCVFEIEI